MPHLALIETKQITVYVAWKTMRPFAALAGLGCCGG